MGQEEVCAHPPVAAYAECRVASSQQTRQAAAMLHVEINRYRAAMNSSPRIMKSMPLSLPLLPRRLPLGMLPYYSYIPKRCTIQKSCPGCTHYLTGEKGTKRHASNEESAIMQSSKVQPAIGRE